MCNSSGGWADTVVKLTPAFFTLVVGAIGCYIAAQQYKLNRDKLRLDLFDKRLAAYDKLQAFFSAVYRDGRVRDESLPILWEARSQGRFLFGPEIQEYYMGLWTKAIEMHGLNMQMYPGEGMGPGLPVGPERNAVAEKHRDILTWMLDQTNNVDPLFAKYLHFA